MISIKADNIGKHYVNNAVIEKFSGEFRTGECIGIFGPNGSGKSTLLRILAGMTEPDSGKAEILMDGKTVSAEDRDLIMAYVSPTVGLPEEMTAEKFSQLLKLAGKNDVLFRKLASVFNLTEFSQKEFGKFSTGMRQRIKLITAFSKEPLLLVLDEAFSNLDDSGKEQLKYLIKKNKEKMLCLISSNIRSELDICNKIIELKKGDISR